MPRKTATQPPKVDALRLADLADGDASALAAHQTFESARYAEADLSGRELSGVTFSECELLACSAHETDFRNARFRETRIEQLNAPTFTASRSTFRDVQVEGSRMGAMELYDSELRSVVVSNCKLGLINLRSSDVRDVIFRGCIIDELDLGEADLARVAFEDCTAGAIDVTRATLQHVDLRGLEIDVVRSVEGMRGSTIGSAQAAGLAGLFAAHLGIRVED